MFDNLVEFLGHDDANKITKRDIIAWRDHRLTKVGPKTVSSADLAAIRTVLNRGVANDRIHANVAETVRQEIPRKPRSRERGYTTAEANRILKYCLKYRAEPDDRGRVRENATTAAVKKWVPLLCAFTGVSLPI
ncbi:hypothetical protein R5H30_17185 [Sulfitobacter sp. D35]|uniref:hypothetical protein n=1 Tax=Sulfitobacter sp. D35 TaxID=3083252 RepID=UPI00296FCB89|nr:hypothetical protein [Sulfitobacter sp. D35]MDW4499731.1 hypothetical protein [Sulfitobacter sp. D35]